MNRRDLRGDHAIQIFARIVAPLRKYSRDPTRVADVLQGIAVHEQKTRIVAFANEADSVIGAQKQQVTLPARTPLVAVVSASPDAAPRRLEVATSLRDAGLRVRADGLSRTLSKQLEAAAKAGARWAVLLGEPGLARATLRDLESGDQQDLALDTLAAEVVKAVDQRTASRGSK